MKGIEMIKMCIVIALLMVIVVIQGVMISNTRNVTDAARLLVITVSVCLPAFWLGQIKERL